MTEIDKVYYLEYLEGCVIRYGDREEPTGVGGYVEGFLLSSSLKIIDGFIEYCLGNEYFIGKDLVIQGFTLDYQIDNYGIYCDDPYVREHIYIIKPTDYACIYEIIYTNVDDYRLDPEFNRFKIRKTPGEWKKHLLSEDEIV